MAKTTCGRSDCDKPRVKHRSYCKKHERESTAKSRIKCQGKPCAIDGCDKPRAISNTRCQKHTSEDRRKYKIGNSDRLCCMDGCDELRRGQSGYCIKHHRRASRKSGIKNQNKPCAQCKKHPRVIRKSQCAICRFFKRFDENNLYKAKAKKIYNRLTYDQVVELIYAPCVYSGHQDQYGNGIDRIDSDGDYKIGNVETVWVVWNCAKRTMSKPDFQKAIDELVKFQTIALNSS